MLPSLRCAARILRATIAVYHRNDRVLDVVAAGVSLRTSAKRRLLQGEVYARRVLGKYTGAEHGDGLNTRSILSLTTLGATRIPISKNSAYHGVPVCFHGSRRAYTCAKRLARQRSSKQSRLFNKHLPVTEVKKGCVDSRQKTRRSSALERNPLNSCGAFRRHTPAPPSSVYAGLSFVFSCAMRYDKAREERLKAVSLASKGVALSA